ncbi:MAG: tRNA dihydrouridine synthase DusB [Candidatus Obscuribacterales bacterium]|nr:tRNA dihydrouridine synthase DusB [Candidatus Obscuribacterales bacterium]
MPIKIGSLTIPGRVYVPPMAGVTDLVFRDMVRSVDKGCMLATEMVSSQGLLNRPETRLMDLSSDEHPIGIQIFGHELEAMANAAEIAERKGADFIDINMGCPVPKITNGKDGCALMLEPELAADIVRSVKSAVSIPVTVKFRLGWDDSTRNCVEFGEMMEAAGASAVTVHGRTRQQRYAGTADWEFIAHVKKALSVPVFGNGDIFEPEDAVKLLEITGCDGVAVARGTLGNPWLIPRITKYLDEGILDDPPDTIERLICAVRHALGLIRYKGVRVGTNESRRHLTHYTKGISHSAPYRARLTQIKSAREIVDILCELAEQSAGSEAKRRFLASVENYDFEDCKHPSERDGNSKDCFEPPVNVGAILPVAKPYNAV